MHTRQHHIATLYIYILYRRLHFTAPQVKASTDDGNTLGDSLVSCQVASRVEIEDIATLHIGTRRSIGDAGEVRLSFGDIVNTPVSCLHGTTEQHCGCEKE